MDIGKFRGYVPTLIALLMPTSLIPITEKEIEVMEIDIYEFPQNKTQNKEFSSLVRSKI